MPDDKTGAPEAGALGNFVEWMTRNRVAANLLMMTLLFGGVASIFTIKQEVFPSFQLDVIDIEIRYPGASPAEVEDGLILPLEEDLRGLEVVERIVATANEGKAAIELELVEGTDPNRALQEVKNAVDQISFFPEEAERPTLGLRQEESNVMWMVVYGPLSERQILDLAERMRRELLLLPEVTRVEVRSERTPEIHIDIPQATLRSLGMTLDEAAQIIRQSARDVPGGGVQTAAGEVLLSTRERRDFASEYGNIVLKTNDAGVDVRVADVAEIRESFVDRPMQNFFNGGRGIFVS
ncbi:MAG: efflux RND transporter permease subunit, partial [Candidatus Hydrogenedentes bacterium]|nr:efflux RND transporter permease subunit [Candidatus Hydrogenedentota bacterium]